MVKMKVIGNFVRKDFGNQILVFMIPFVIAICLVISMCCYSVFYNAIREEKQESTQNLNSQIAMQLDSKIDTVKALASYLTLNKQLENAMKHYQDMDNIEKHSLKEELKNDLGSIEIFMDCILDIIFVGENGFRYNLPARESLNHEKYNLKKDWFESFIDGEIPRFYYSTVHLNQYYDTRKEKI